MISAAEVSPRQGARVSGYVADTCCRQLGAAPSSCLLLYSTLHFQGAPDLDLSI